MHLLTELKEGLGISWRAIRANKMRSVLTTLGIVIGIVTVTLMGTAIEGLNRAFIKSISFLGADVLYVSRFNWLAHSREEWDKMEKRREITLAQVEALTRQLTLARAVAPSAQVGQSIQYQKRRSNNVDVTGTTEQFLFTSGSAIASGRFFSSPEASGGRPVCVIGSMVATNLFPRESPLGKKVSIGDRAFEVVGVLEKQGGILDGGNIDNQAIIPLKQFLTAFWSDPDYTIAVKAKSPEQLEETKEELRVALRRVRRVAPHDEDDFAINQLDQIVDMFHKEAGVIAAIGLFITGLSLFVGGIGIMNIMFVSVAERTREIGIRKAIGAQHSHILIQFLVEAVLLAGIGGLLGVAVGIAGTHFRIVNVQPLVEPYAVFLAFGFAVFTGLFFGIYPANRAATLRPIDALRYE
jgi:putative ABC transport system permease protein